MDALGIPTTRALAMVANDEAVYRESIETAAIVVRLAPSFVRFGSFEIFRRAASTTRSAFSRITHRPVLSGMRRR